MRNAYPELVVSGVDSNWSGQPRCDYSTVVKIRFLAEGIYTRGHVTLGFHPAAADWARALAAVMLHHGYKFRESAGGSLSCRKITGGGRTSLHAHGVAADFNPSVNRYRRSVGPFQWGKQTDMGPAMIFDIEQIQTVDGRVITMWGGRWWNVKDPMHFQPSKVTREQLERGVDFRLVPGWADYLAWTDTEDIVIRLGDNNELVGWYQALLNAAGADPRLGVDGKFGSVTEAAVVAYQETLRLSPTGVIDGPLAAKLSSYSNAKDNRYAKLDHTHDPEPHDQYAPIDHGHRTEGNTI
jgi:hypothetical protein